LHEIYESIYPYPEHLKRHDLRAGRRRVRIYPGFRNNHLRHAATGTPDALAQDQ
jgi:hypothetical protein